MTQSNVGEVWLNGTLYQVDWYNVRDVGKMGRWRMGIVHHEQSDDVWWLERFEERHTLYVSTATVPVKKNCKMLCDAQLQTGKNVHKDLDDTSFTIYRYHQELFLELNGKWFEDHPLLLVKESPLTLLDESVTTDELRSIDFGPSLFLSTKNPKPLIFNILYVVGAVFFGGFYPLISLAFLFLLLVNLISFINFLLSPVAKSKQVFRNVLKQMLHPHNDFPMYPKMAEQLRFHLNIIRKDKSLSSEAKTRLGLLWAVLGKTSSYSFWMGRTRRHMLQGFALFYGDDYHTFITEDARELQVEVLNAKVANEAKDGFLQMAEELLEQWEDEPKEDDFERLVTPGWLLLWARDLVRSHDEVKALPSNF